ncbi:MAG: sugar transferase [Chloroflexi bacterium]|nr:sugar transferase [Chloroflexota bacterium]MBV9133984.1 sugar transferase [Chloroflexota bacterium]
MDGQRTLEGVARVSPEPRHLDHHRSKRLIDLVLASVLLVALLPLLIVISVAIAIDSPGTILYVQPRAGYRGEVFRMLKFRTMHPDRRVRRVPIPFPERRKSLKVKHDPRITRVGHVLRRLSLDELPQLINVLHGDMSFVGPRPELPELVAQYGSLHYARHQMLPGVTGWWQTHGRCTRPDGCDTQTDLATKLADDIYYMQHWSLSLDVKILLLTVPVVLRGPGAN